MKLYRKSSDDDKRQLDITAQVELDISADNRMAKVLVLVQPGSESACQIGINLIPKLGIQLLRADGEPIVAKVPQDTGTVRVRVVHSTTIPARKGMFVDAIVD